MKARHQGDATLVEIERVNRQRAGEIWATGGSRRSLGLECHKQQGEGHGRRERCAFSSPKVSSA